MSALKRNLLSIFCWTSITCFSQIDENKADVRNYEFKTINLSAASEIKLALPVSTIEVHDVRFDTSCLGIHPVAQSQRLYMIRFKNSLPDEIKDFFYSLADSMIPGNPELHCFIKKLMLTDYIDANNIDKQKASSKTYDADIKSGVLFTAEFYSKLENDYIPLCRVDTVIIGSKDVNKAGGIYISDALIGSLKKVSKLNWEKIKQDKRLKVEEINSYYNKRFDLPILNTAPVKGLYLNFKDFLNNMPSNSEFTVDKNQRGDFLYVKNEKNEEMLFTDLWGYCDGKDIYIYSASNYFKLQRTGNSFKVYGAKDFTAHRNLRLNMRLTDLISPNSSYSKGSTQNKYSLVKNFFQLDMDTGELY